MYIPRPFLEDRVDVLHRTMVEIGAAAIVGQGPQGLIATHAPIEVDPEPAPWGTVRCHFARANPQVRQLAAGSELLLICQGPQGYVSPGWYPSKADGGKVVPTWNFIAIHAYGTPILHHDPAWLRRHVAALTDRFEHGRAEPWHVDDAPADYIEGMCKAIVGIEIPLSRIEGKWKLSQNRSEVDRRGVVTGLRTEGGPASARMADLVEEALHRDAGKRS